MLPVSSPHAVIAAIDEVFVVAPSDPAAAALLLNRLVDAAVGAWLAAHPCHSGSVEDQLATLRKEDAATATLLEAVLLGPSLERRMDSASRLAKHIAGHREGFTWDCGDRRVRDARGEPLPISLPVGGIITPV